MSSLKKFVESSIGKKVVMAITGLALFFFLIIHLIGNLTLFSSDPALFNGYAHKLHTLKPLVITAEIFLLAFFIMHIVSGVSVAIGKRKARPISYYKTASAGGASKKTISSSTMIITGIVILVFTVIHIKTFKYGPSIAEGYSIDFEGETVRDLHRLVVEKFSQLPYVLFYVLCMLFLGFHLRHAFWSAFQSLGIHHPRSTPVLYGMGLFCSILLATGFILLPLWIYCRGAGG
ncbi:MAG: succinate dehydrogenase [Kiritimatiellae bacterium]|nr:succinate dehydrogenase [Kiritimatiellia bacterium]